MEEHFNFIISTSIMLFLVMNPLGNLPIFASILRHFSDADYRRIIIRESIFALIILLIFLFFGNGIIKLLHISIISMRIAGGIILFMIAIKMVFGRSQTADSNLKEPMITPLATPLFAGPSTISMIILTRGSSQATLETCLISIIVTWFFVSLILFTGRLWEKLLGTKILDALESLMGFLLTVVAVQMLLDGIHLAFPKV
ncbi:MAG: MarC family protein [Planctomycetia bacterium]|nr:MarC family protein [Planctomycetia bacterium]